jgi:hypothetical protein
MKFDPDYLATLAEATEFHPANLEKVVRLGNLVAQLSVHAFLNQMLVLKGGTAQACSSNAPMDRIELDLNFLHRVPPSPSTQLFVGRP